MSIVQLKKVTLLAPSELKDEVIEDLQRLGCLHLIPLGAEGEPSDDGAGPSRQAREALKFLASCTDQRRQVTDASQFDPIAVEEEALALQKRLYDLREERDYLAQRLTNLERWGDFAYAPLDEMNGLRLWFYVVPKREMEAFRSVELPWEIVNSDERDHYVIVISSDEPKNIPFERTLTGWRSPAQLAKRLEETELAIEDAEAERASLTRWVQLFARGLDGLEDYAARQYAARQTFDDAPLFAMQAWAPEDRLAELEAYVSERGFALETADPSPDDAPPTKFHNPPRLRAGEDLVTFYQTPAYRLWDPSSVVFFSFAIFFAMIISDAGYGLVLALITAWLWKRMGASEKGRERRVLLTTLSATTIVYGVLCGGYFGVTPEPDTVLGLLQVVDPGDSGTMMAISIALGGAHLIFANLMDAARMRTSLASLAPLGWALVMVGGLLLGARLLVETMPVWPGAAAGILGLVLVVLFTGYGDAPLKRTARGVLAIASLTSAFGDVLSYLRLFALGLASASLAAAFNDMAADVRTSFPGVGLLFALLVLLLGHTLNFVLSLASAVIHGMRLNVIEFFNWGVKEEGNPFRAFQRKGSE